MSDSGSDAEMEIDEVNQKLQEENDDNEGEEEKLEPEDEEEEPELEPEQEVCRYHLLLAISILIRCA
jgi:Ino eighty subunit 2